MYDPMLVQPMREEVTRLGFQELRTAEEVDQTFRQQGTTLVFINSVCGCSAGGARPALALAGQHDVQPDRKATAFAGNDVEAVKQARSYFVGFAPSSPSMAIIKDGELVWMLERWQIEGRHPIELANSLKEAFNQHCSVKAEA
jgi:putative YphP/YqiW family bacilliredoxin